MYYEIKLYELGQQQLSRLLEFVHGEENRIFPPAGYEFSSSSKSPFERVIVRVKFSGQVTPFNNLSTEMVTDAMVKLEVADAFCVDPISGGGETKLLTTNPVVNRLIALMGGANLNSDA